MGRRVTGTTKGGKFMNPTDQARKQARKKELRKNKKQRIMVRQAVIKTKDPRQMFLELDQLDEMELNPHGEQPYNEKVIKEKRRKLIDNLERIVAFYTKEDGTYAKDLRNLINNYNRDRMKKEVYYESVKNAQEVKIDSIPLPDDPMSTVALDEIPLPGAVISKPPSILRKQSAYDLAAPKKKAPGPPPGPPPLKKNFKGNVPGQLPRPPPLIEEEYNVPEKSVQINEPEAPPYKQRRYDDEDSDEEFQHRDEDAKEAAGITPLQAMMLKLAGQNPQAAAAKQKEEDQAGTSRQSRWNDEEYEPSDEAPGPPPGLPPAMMNKNSQMMPPGPPSGRPPTMPPGPPPGLPPSMPRNMNSNESIRGPPSQVRGQSNVFSAPPSLISRPAQPSQPTEVAPTIVAKPKLTSTTKVDVTRFMPTSLRVNRETKGKKSEKSKTTTSNLNKPQKPGQNRRTADAAYDSFMEEMQGLL